MSAQVQRLWGLPVVITRITPPADLRGELAIIDAAVKALKAEGHSMVFRVVDFSEADRSFDEIVTAVGCDDFYRDLSVKTLVVGPAGMARVADRDRCDGYLVAVYPSVGEALAAI
jgi:hypothetical protein